MVSEIQNINIDLILPNRFQPRLVFDEKSLNELAESIKEHGLLEPIIVRQLNDKYEIIAGERRYKAATLAGLTTIPAIVKNLNDYKSAQVAIVENVQRRNLNPIEEAKSYKRILEKGQITQEELAKQLSVSQSTIANKLRLLNLDKNVQQALSENKISERHARSLLKIDSNQKQNEILTKVINNKMTVRDLEAEIKTLTTLQETNVINDTYENTLEPAPIELIEQSIKEQPTVTQPEEIDNITKNLFDFKTLFNNQKEEEKQPSLEDLTTNLDVGIQDEILNPFKYIEEEPIEQPKESQIQIDEPILIPEIEPKQIKKIKSNDLDSVKEAIIELKDEIQTAGYDIAFEDYDFTDLYQVIIKINKQSIK